MDSEDRSKKMEAQAIRSSYEDTVMVGIQTGDIVQRRHPWDGTARAGQPAGPELIVLKVYSCDTFSICCLSDGKSEFEFNLNKQSAVDFHTAHHRKAAG
jgi:hypothetical protein